MEAGKFCTHCGKELKGNGEFCPYCGNKIIRVAPAHQQAPAKKKSMLPLFLGIGLVAVVLTGFGISLVISGKEKNVVGDFSSLVDKLNPAKMGAGEAPAVEKAEEAEVEDVTEVAEAPDAEVVFEAPEEANDVPKWKNSYIKEISSSSGIFSLKDINADGIPELFLIADNQVRISTCDENGNVDSVECDDSVLGIDASGNRICASYVDGNVIHDSTLKLENGKWTVEQRGTTEVYCDGASENGVTAKFSLNDSSADSDDYYSWIQEIYLKADSLEDLPFVKCSSGSEVIDSLTDAKDISNFSDTAYLWDIDEKYGCENTVKIILAPAEDDYVFELKGGAGGADGERALSGQSYDGNGGLLSGKIHMNVGDRAYVVVGGAGGITQAARGVVAGGFNGGGDAFWSGGGGGSTDVYFKGQKVASASGGGGGNYSENGEPGRSSEDSKNKLDSRLGGATGASNIDDAGGGGGAGWYGGTAGKIDQAGHGGVNGYNGVYFSLISESRGAAATQKNTQDGYANVYRQWN